MYGQGLQFTRNKKTKEIKLGTRVNVSYSKDHLADDCDYCTRKSVTGILTSVTKDSLTIDVMKLEEFRKTEDFAVLTNLQYLTKPKLQSIPKEEVFEVKIKTKKDEDLRIAFSALIITAGVTTVISSLFLKNKESRKRLATIGAAETGLGFIGLLIGARKSYDLRKTKEIRWAIL